MQNEINELKLKLKEKELNEIKMLHYQTLYEKELLKLVDMCPHKNLILMGGCALNCVANSKIQGKNIWIKIKNIKMELKKYKIIKEVI